MTEAPEEYVDDVPDDDAPDQDAPNDDQDPVFLADGGSGEASDRLDESSADAFRTGDPRVDEVLAGLGALHGLPVDQHAAVFDRAHDSLRKALDPDRESA